MRRAHPQESLSNARYICLSQAFGLNLRAPSTLAHIDPCFLLEPFMPLSTTRQGFKLALALLMIGALIVPADAKSKKGGKKSKKAAIHKVVAPPGPPVPGRSARPVLVIDAKTGDVLQAVNPHTPWHPASLTKVMTAYVALQAIKARRLSKDSLLTVSALAAKQRPSKMAFAPGTKITLESALFILFVKSANDVAVTVAEGISGSVPAFADEMNAWSRRLGMSNSVWRNPNGWHDDQQVTTARDMALLARAIYRDFPEYQHLYRAQALQYGEWTMRNYNVLIGRFAGADGLKTGFTCPSGFNLVASATRGGRRHIAVVLGENSGKARGEKAALLLERSFTVPAAGEFEERLKVESLARPSDVLGKAPNMRHEVCSGHGNPSEADETGVSTQIHSLVPTAEATEGAKAAAEAGGEKAALVTPPPAQVTAVVLARTVVSPKDKRPLTVAVAGTALVGAGLPLPTIALQPADIRSTTSNTASFSRDLAPSNETPARPEINTNQAPIAASLVPQPLTAPGAPIALVPAQKPIKPGAISGASKAITPAKTNPAAAASLVTGGKVAPVNSKTAPGALGAQKTAPQPKAQPTATPTPE